MCRKCVLPLVDLANGYRQNSNEMMSTAEELMASKEAEQAVEMQHWAGLEQTFGLVFQTLASLMAIATRDDPEGHLDLPSLN